MTDERMEALTALLDEIRIGKNRGWIKAVTPDKGKVFFHFDNFPVPLADHPCVPFPEHACTSIDKQLLERIMHEAWARMTQVPLFASILMPAPTIATMMTGVPSREHIDAFDRGLEELEELYSRLLREHGGDAESFYDTAEARTIIDGALLATARRDMQLREYNSRASVGWDPIVATPSVYFYYSRIIDIMSATAAFTRTGDFNHEACRNLIATANIDMINGITKAFNDAVARPELAAAITHARHNVVGSRFVGIDADAICPLIEEACITFTYATLVEMEKWILTVCGFPKELHASLLCTAQPKVGFAAGKLNKDGIHWQEELRSVRSELYSSVWHHFLFDEEFTDEEERPMIDDVHLSRDEYKLAVFGALVRMSYDEATLSVLACQYAMRDRPLTTLEELSPVVSDPLVLYDAHSDEVINCSELFRE